MNSALVGADCRIADLVCAANVEFCRGIQNPIGIKCGPSLSSAELKKLLDILNPENEAGRITLICRFGAEEENT